MKTLTAIAFAALATTTSANAACLTYNTPLSLEGMLVRHTFMGPSHLANGKDRPETYWLLRLPAATCVAQGTGKYPEEEPPIPAIQEFQLMLGEGAYDEYRGLVGKKVGIVGTLDIGGGTGHYHTPVSIAVAQFLVQGAVK